MSGAKKGGRDLSGFNYGAMSSLVVNQGVFHDFACRGNQI